MRYETDGDAAWLTIDRPGSANALGADDLNEIRTLVARAEEEARVAVITGAGEHFCAGGDLDEIASIDGMDEGREFAGSLVGAFCDIETADVPVIAAVNGDAFGAGLELVVACDLAVAATDARFGAPEARMGVQPPLTVERAGSVAGRKRVSELVLTCEPIDAATAADWGIVNRAVPPNEIEETVQDFVTSISKTEPEAARLAKERAVGKRDDYDGIVERMAERLAANETRERFRAAAEGADDG